MEISSATSTQSTPSSVMISSRDESMDKLDFLQMLVAQLKAQDPLNPLDSQEYASQLATFSSLQELQKISSSLSDSLLMDQLLSATFSNTMSAFLVGKVVKAETDTVQVGSTGSVDLNYQLSDAATNITIEIKDSSGAVVRTLNPTAQAAGDQTVEWDGLDSSGQRVSAGDYTFSVTATDANGGSVTATTYLEGLVDEVAFEDGTVLLLVGDARIQLGQVLSIRNADSDGGWIRW